MPSISRKKLRIIVTLKLCVFTLLFFSKLKDFVDDHNLFRMHNLPHSWESTIQNQVSKGLCISAMQCDCTFLMMTLAGCLSSHTLVSLSSFDLFDFNDSGPTFDSWDTCRGHWQSVCLGSYRPTACFYVIKV